MPCTVEVLFTPAEFRGLRDRDLSTSTCVVFDVLRATSTFVTALANGAKGIIPVEELSEALAIRQERPEVLLAGERNGLRIGPELTGGIEFDLGNSPREFTPERVRGRVIVSTTTNGTRALRACQNARRVFVASFLNLTAALQAVLDDAPDHLLLVCAGTGEGTALEDAFAAGAVCEQLPDDARRFAMLDSAEVARRIYRACHPDIFRALANAQNARRLLAHPELRGDVEYCLDMDRFAAVPILGRSGVIEVGLG